MKWVRPVVTLIAMGGLTAGFFMDKIESQAYVLAVGVAVTWWFKSRDAEKQEVGKK